MVERQLPKLHTRVRFPSPAHSPIVRSVSHLDPDGRPRIRFIDFYKRGCFILEAKQADNLPPLPLFGGEADRGANIRNTRGWAQHMMRARGQAESYARDVPPAEGNPPFLIVCDVGFCFDLYADFSGLGKHYSQFPDANTFRIYLTDLRDPAIRDRLRAVWTDPHALDPSCRRVEVTRDIAAVLAKLAIALEARHSPDHVATFLMRAVFCMFAQSIGLLPARDSFTDLLEDCAAAPAQFVPLVGDLWRNMNAGGFSPAIRADIRRFNGGLFAPGIHGPAEPLRLDAAEIGLLLSAAKRDWANVEPAIFGTLLENALDPRARGQLGAHFTPRAFVERLVGPTVMNPLREEWDGAQAAAFRLAEDGDPAAAAAAIRRFHARLCTLRILDPACGTGNFLYVTMELMKRLGRGARYPRQPATGRRRAPGAGRRSRRPAPIPRPRKEPARRPRRRTRALDRLPAMALPHHRRRPPRRTDPARLP